MDQRNIGMILMSSSLLMAVMVFMIQDQSETLADEYLEEHNTCFLDDGTCLHKRNQLLYVAGWGLSAALFMFGAYLAFIDKTHKFMAEHQIKVSKALESAMKQERERDEFRAYLSGFLEKEQKIIKAIREQEGISQSTLRFRTGMSKTELSLLLKSLEERKVISRKPHGKTKSVYIVRKF